MKCVEGEGMPKKGTGGFERGKLFIYFRIDFPSRKFQQLCCVVLLLLLGLPSDRNCIATTSLVNQSVCLFPHTC